MDQPPQKTSPSPEEKSAPTLRTMETDARILSHQEPSSLIETLARESDRIHLSPRHPQSRSILFVGTLIAAVLVIGLIGTSFFLPAFSPLKLFSSPPTPVPAPTRPLAGPIFFPVERSEELIIASHDRNEFFATLRRFTEKTYPPDSITGIKIKLRDGEREAPLTLDDFFKISGIEPPQDLLRITEVLPMFFVTSDASSHAHFGFAVGVKDSDRALGRMISWEDSLFAAFNRFFFKEATPVPFGSFENKTFQNIDWRFLAASQDGDSGIGYTVFSPRNILIFTTSSLGMQAIILRLLL